MTEVAIGVVDTDLADRRPRIQVTEGATLALDQCPKTVVDSEPMIAEPIQKPRVVGSAEIAVHILRQSGGDSSGPTRSDTPGTMTRAEQARGDGCDRSWAPRPFIRQ